ncbi:MAG: SUF system NifU family Fe-S cluster assembly protein [Puniceicoccales bacterium]|jgi:nitrogen fixation NifU-like protein|nr:SUF system NifU family Fe-S cluster assembly protein [Puniceicoccales bacterium]
MDATLNELYQDIILEHNRAPRNKHTLPAPAKVARGHNPSCGDSVTVFVAMEGDVVKCIAFDGEGCAISQASASLMTELLSGKTKREAGEIIDAVCRALGDADGCVAQTNPLEQYGEVAALIGVKKFPMRIKCATLAWHAAKDAMA